MKKKHNCTYSGLFAVTLLTSVGISLDAQAQFRGQDSQQFFEQGNQIMEQQIQQIQRGNSQQLEEKIRDEQSLIDTREKEAEEKKLEAELQIQKPSGIEVIETPADAESLDFNVPESPMQEIEITP